MERAFLTDDVEEPTEQSRSIFQLVVNNSAIQGHKISRRRSHLGFFLEGATEFYVATHRLYIPFLKCKLCVCFHVDMFNRKNRSPTGSCKPWYCKSIILGVAEKQSSFYFSSLRLHSYLYYRILFLCFSAIKDEY